MRHIISKLGFCFLAFFISSNYAVAQEELTNNLELHTLPRRYETQDLIIPNAPNYNAITFTVKGGDGGGAKVGDCKANGGQAATATASFLIGDGPNQLPPGTLVRFFVGEAGYMGAQSGAVFGTAIAAGGGGGGSAVMAQIHDSWVILAVGGGGGGAYQGQVASFCVDSQAGQGGRTGTGGGGGEGSFAGDGGTNANGGEGGGGIGAGDLSGGGGGASTDGTGEGCWEGEYGFPFGGTGGGYCTVVADPIFSPGGWGFGGGGVGDEAGGGGGGYSGGGGGGALNNGGGGGSYVNTTYAYTSNIAGGSNLATSQNGTINYQFRDICLARINGFEYINSLCSADAQGRIQLTTNLQSGSTCNSELTFFLSPLNGWSYLGDGIFRAVRAGTYTASVINTTYDHVVDTFTFTVAPTTEAPTARCKNTTVTLSNGFYSNNSFFNVINDGSSGPCDASLAASQSSFSCDDIGIKTVTLTVTGTNNKFSTCESKVTVQLDPSDQPVAKCYTNRTFDLGGNTLNLSANDIDNGDSSVGVCSANMSISPSTFDCDDIGQHTVTLSIQNGANSASCTTNVTITDNNTPTANCKPQLTITLNDQGVASITPNQVNNISVSNNCTTVSAGLSQYDFDCTHLGDNQVIFTVYDGYGRTNSCSSTITVQDNISPIAVCKDITVGLDENGLGTITADQLDGGSTDLCDLTFSTPITTFDCEDIGTTSQVLTVTDQGGNQHSCTAQVTVVDNTAPKAICTDFTFSFIIPGLTLNPTQLSYLTYLSTDNCSSKLSTTIERSTPFGCEDVGTQEVTMRLTDDYGNSSTCTAMLTILDGRQPTLICQDVTLQIDANGTAALTTAMVDKGSFDECGLASLSLDKYLFDCEDIGTNTVTLTAIDVNGKEGTCTANVEVEKTTEPIAKCQDLTVFLDEGGLAEVVAADIDNGSNDVCGLSSMTLDQNSFDCDDVGQHILTLTVTNSLGNSSNCQATVEVKDDVLPVALCKDASIEIDQSSVALVTPAAIDNGSQDACGLSDLSLDEVAFVCNQTGDHIVTLTVTDNNGNSNTCEATVSVLDLIAPTVSCQNVTIQLDENGAASLSPTAVVSDVSDICGIADLSLDQTDFSCVHVGDQMVILTATDNNGNSNSCDATVTIVDEIHPTLTCTQHMIVNSDEGECGAYVTLPKAAPADNCGIKDLKSRYRPLDEVNNLAGSWSAWDSDHSGFFELGTFEIQWRATDHSNNQDFCSFTLDVIDEEAPQIVCKHPTIAFNGEATISIPPAIIFDEAASFDACGAVNFVSQSLSLVNCDHVGQTLDVQVIGMDPNGNMGTCTAQVSVVGMPCGFEATDIDCEQGAAAGYDPAEDTYTLSADDCSGYPQGEFSFVGTELCGDGEITVRVSGLVGDGRAGVVMMESTDPGSRRVSMLKSQTRQVTTEYRLSSNGNLFQKHKNRSGVEWVRIVRIGNKFKTYTSTNGSSWKLAHLLNYSNFADCVYAGIMAYSRRSYDPVTATFDQLSVTAYGNTALAALPTGTSAVMEEATELSRSNDFLTHDLALEVAPNPFSDQTRITFELAKKEEVILDVYNLQGQLVKRLIDAQLPAGIYQERWTGTDANEQVMSSGVYLLRLQVGQGVLSKKVSLITN